MSAVSEYTDARAGVLRSRYQARFDGPELPVPVASIAEDRLGLTIREAELDVSGMLIPAEREIVLNARESAYPGRRRFSIAHELGHWICHVAGAEAAAPVCCRAADVEPGAARAPEREANIFAEPPMPEEAMRGTWTRTADAAARPLAVSSVAMRWRLFSFGLFEEAPA
jgi:Zn-dependent peptidase ImmA (M78 family)